MTAKEKAIAAAYGEAWEMVKYHVDENGWIESMKFSYYQNLNGMSDEPIINIFGGRDSEFIDTTYRYAGWRKESVKIWRPEALRGVEHNNGWMRITDATPNEGMTVYLAIGTYVERVDHFHRRWHKSFTHWKPVEAVKPPIY